MKICSKCGVEKPLEEFHKYKGNKDGLEYRCKTCRKADNAEHYARPEVKAAKIEHNTRPEVKAAQWGNYLLCTYKLTTEDYNNMLEAQNHVCAICLQSETQVRNGSIQRLSVDHNHSCCHGRKSCGECIRGLLCNRCNVLVGKLEIFQIIQGLDKIISSDPLMNSVIQYLIRWSIISPPSR